jgi:hypothetical protein
MKRIASFWLLAIFLVGAGAILSSAQAVSGQDQPLGDYARAHKKDKKAAVRTFDNDNLPAEDRLNIVGKSAPENPDAQSAPSQGPARDQAGEGVTEGKPPAEGKHAVKVDKMPEVSPGESAEDRQKVYDKWQDKLTGQQDKVDLANRELDVLQREYKLRAAEFYADAGNRLRNQADWDKKDADYKKQLEEKQKALTEAQQELENMQEDARKAGVPSSIRDKAATNNPQD